MASATSLKICACSRIWCAFKPGRSDSSAVNVNSSARRASLRFFKLQAPLLTKSINYLGRTLTKQFSVSRPRRKSQPPRIRRHRKQPVHGRARCDSRLLVFGTTVQPIRRPRRYSCLVGGLTYLLRSDTPEPLGAGARTCSGRCDIRAQEWSASAPRTACSVAQIHLDRLGQTGLGSCPQIPPAEATEASLRLRHLTVLC